ncbi:MAG: thioredoxin domain-containing protein [Myxococcales bacterium]|nr:thioredoxin domain-containing protein [Myxococcales bacterium]
MNAIVRGLQPGSGAGVWLVGGWLFWVACGSTPPPTADVVAVSSPPRAEQPAAEAEVADVPLPDEDVVRLRVETVGAASRGAVDALVTIVIFSDFECPFCARVEPTLERLLQAYPGELRIVWRDNPLPFHRNAMPAAEIAREAFRQGGDPLFWQMHALLFENQRQLGRSELEGYAAALGMDVAQVRRALDDGTHRASIEEDQRAAARLGARGTPGFFINGRKLMGAQPYDNFDEIVREELALARAEVAQGVPASAVYARRMQGALTEAPAEPPRVAAPPEEPAVYAVPVPARAPSRGPANARVTIQIFSDFQCPFCGRIRPTLDQILQAHPNDVRIIWRDYPLPFHQQAMPAAEAAREVFAQVGDAGFWRFHDLVFDAFGQRRSLDTDALVELAREVRGVDPRQVRRALERQTHRPAIEADMRAVQDAGARIGTPSSFINGRLVSGAQPFEAFEAVIARELAASP